jgi:hypothetical protein
VARINVLVATTALDWRAGIIAEAVAARPDMNLLVRPPVAASEVDALLQTIPATPRCALVIVGPVRDTDEPAKRWLAQRPDLVVMDVDVDVGGNTARIAVRAPRLDPVLTALRELVEHAAAREPEAQPEPEQESNIYLVETSEPQAEALPDEPKERPLLDAAIEWVHKLLRDAVENVPEENDDARGLCVSRETLLHALDTPVERRPSNSLNELFAADEALDRALADADPATEPLAAVVHVFALTPVEFRMLLLALAPELDLRFQRCIGFLLDEMSRRVGTLGLYSTLLGPAARVRLALADNGALARWLVFEGATSHPAAADEPLRLDPFLSQWLLGDRIALAYEPRIRRAIRAAVWPGTELLQRREERMRAAELITEGWLLLTGDDPAGWRALLEIGASDRQAIRVELARFAGVDLLEIEDAARRIGRMARLTGEPLFVDATGVEDDDVLRVFFTTLDATRCDAAVIATDAARMVKLLGAASYELLDEPALPNAARADAVREAAIRTGAYLTTDAAEAIANRYPLSIDRIEQAMRLALTRPETRDAADRFTAAAREVAGEGLSHLAERIEPIFTLEQVVLPPDRKLQLEEIVDHVRLAPRVLDEWKFGEQLPYGRGVTALFHGPSGTGKTMAALAIARRLGIQLLRLDFSKVVSKYIGDTEKNIDRVFTDAQQSGAAILIDEADALLGKRSEVKDAHDRYANIEVAYLLQRMEAYEGLAILTTNMRQNIDPAFLRRLRFVVDFPAPDVDAREQIWRQCLPEGSHELDDAAFRQLARKINLSGGYIRQITLHAAFLAAAAGVKIGLEHIAQAARAEFAKLGMPPVALDLSQGRKAA